MRVNIGGTFKEVSGIKVNIAGAWLPVARIRAYQSGAWKEAGTFVGALSASINITEPYGSTYGVSTVTTETVTVTPIGGLAPYSYAWTRLSGTGAANSPSSASTSFTDTVGDVQINTGLFRCTVTDALGSTATVNAEAVFENYGPLGP